MTILLSDPRVAMVPVHDNGDPLVPLDPAIGRRTFVRAGLADRLLQAQAQLPAGIDLRVVEGHRSEATQLAIVAAYSAQLCAAHPGIAPDELRRLSSRFVAPIDATPEQSGGRCWFAADGIGPDARAHRNLLASVLGSVGLVNYPTEWWHWSYGDRYWALLTGHPHALYGSVATGAAA